jgi:membrane associated rhomboid family serine protease
MDLLDRILRLLGTNKVRVRWKLQALRDSLKRKARSVENRSRSLAYEHQLCPKCGHPAAKDDKTCVRCNTPLQGVVLSRARRMVGALIPEGFPIVTALLLAACLALYFVTLKATHDVTGGSGPRGEPDGRVLLRFGANSGWFVGSLGEWWRFVTSIFLHGGVAHIVMNGLGLFILGRYLEERFGRARSLVVFVIGGIAGSALSHWWRFSFRGEVGMSVGASGAIFALMGVIVAHAARDRRARGELRERFIPMLLFAIIVSFRPGVDFAAHFGGLAAGAVFGGLLADTRTARKAPAWAWNVAALATLALVVWSFVTAIRWDMPPWL